MMAKLRMEVNLNAFPPPPLISPPGVVISTWKSEKDSSDWADIINSCFPELGIVWDAQRFQERYGGCIEFEKEGFFIAREGSIPIATCFAWSKDGDHRVHWLGVRASHRGQGLANLLLGFVLNHFVTRGIANVALVVESYRLPAIRLYLKHGE